MFSPTNTPFQSNYSTPALRNQLSVESKFGVLAVRVQLVYQKEFELLQFRKTSKKKLKLQGRRYRSMYDVHGRESLTIQVIHASCLKHLHEFINDLPLRRIVLFRCVDRF
jgi:hypothetical protein